MLAPPGDFSTPGWHPVGYVWTPESARHYHFRYCQNYPRRYSPTTNYSRKGYVFGGGYVGRHGIFFVFFFVLLSVTPFLDGVHSSLRVRDL